MLEKFETTGWDDMKPILSACTHITDPLFASTTIEGLDAVGCQLCRVWYDRGFSVKETQTAQAPTKPTEAIQEIAIEKLFPHLLEEME